MGLTTEVFAGLVLSVKTRGLARVNGHRDVGYVRLAAVQHDDGEDVCALEVDACFGSLLYESRSEFTVGRARRLA